ncbi:MAG: glycosyltransferase family 2 protein [Acidobacteriaceae bacterium]|nr:glycosyltransferase family 2 protein [Acidobacteriaceae bacterium]
MSDLPPVAVTIVTFNSAKYIRRCLDLVLDQDYARLSVVVVDNSSSDDTLEQVRAVHAGITVIANDRNIGFAAGQNQAITAAGEFKWVLVLNPDVRLTRTFVSDLVDAGQRDADVGTVCGKLLAMGEDFLIPAQAAFDSTGIYMTPNLRHLDRGSKLPDKGQFDSAEYVFGATGAAALFREAMIRDISIDGEFFDSDFFAYREDADVAWRAQLLGWKCLYVPQAVAYHVRSVLPSNRKSVPAIVNMHSVKNRFLLRIKNTTPGLYSRFWLPITLRDCAVIAGCLVGEWRSVPAFWFVLRHLRQTFRKRAAIMPKRRVSEDYICGWFSVQPVSLPICANRRESSAVKTQPSS